MPYFLKTAEIKGASKYPAFQQTIELFSFQRISDTEIEIALSSAEFNAKMQLFEYVGSQDLKISKAVLTTAIGVSPLIIVGTIEMTNVRVTKTHLSGNGINYFSLSGNEAKSNCLRDPADGMPTGKRMHKPIVITKELDKSTPILMNKLVNNEDIERWEIDGFYKK